MAKPKGGRGKTAAYETTHIRVPLPLKERVQKIIEMWHDGQLEYHDELTAEDHRLANEYRNLLTSKASHLSKDENSLTPIRYDEAVVNAKKILNQRKAARESLRKLLTAIYGIDTEQL